MSEAVAQTRAPAPAGEEQTRPPTSSAKTGIYPELSTLSVEGKQLFDDVFGAGSGAAHARRFEWQYGQGGTGAGSHLDLFWHQGRAVGSLGTLPTTLYVNGAAQAAYFTADLTSSPDYRNRGIGARLMQAFVKQPGIPLALAVSPDARTLLLRMGFEEVPLTVMFRVLSLEAMVMRKDPIAMRDARLAPIARIILRFLDSARPIWSPAAAVGAALRSPPGALERVGGQPVLRVWQSILANVPGLGTSGVAITHIEHFPESVDALHQRLAAEWPVAHLPSSANLNRRYSTHPSHQYLIQLAHPAGHSSHTDPCGYAVWRTFVEPDGRVMAHLMALVTAPGARDVQDALLHAGVEALVARRAYAIKAVVSHPAMQAALQRHLFFAHGESPGLYFHTTESTVREHLRQPWLIGLGASDADVG